MKINNNLSDSQQQDIFGQLPRMRERRGGRETEIDRGEDGHKLNMIKRE